MANKLIYISYYFPPIRSIAVKRNYAFVMGLKKYFEEVHVFTTSNTDVFDKEEKSFKGIHVNEVFTFDYRTIISYLQKKNKSHFDEGSKSNVITKFLIKANESFPINLFLGEGGLFYIINCYIKSSKILRREPKSLVISSYRPFANVFVGFLLKQRFKNIKWIVSFHDFPIDDVRKNILIPSFEKFIWTKILKNADLSITVSDGLNQKISNLHSRVSTILNGVEVKINNKTISNYFNIVYTGSLYKDLSCPQIVFKCLANLIIDKKINEADIKIIYAGKDALYWLELMKPYLAESIFVNKGEISSSEAIALQEKANINLLLTWATKDHTGVLTGKFYEYLACDKPILAIINGNKDIELNNIFEKTQCGKAVATQEIMSENEVLAFIYDNYILWKNGKFYPTYKHNLNSMRWEDQIEKLIEKIY
jgi:hypothetical protein